MNEVQKLVLFTETFEKELKHYQVPHHMEIYIPSAVNFAMLTVIADFHQHFINEFELEKQIDIIKGYDYAYNDGMITLKQLYNHLREIMRFDVFMVHEDDMHKFRLDN